MRAQRPSRSPSSATRPRRGAWLLVPLFGCAWLRSTPVETPPEAPDALSFAHEGRDMRDRVLPPRILFSGQGYADRLVCRSGELPGWKQLRQEGPIETYEIRCPDQSPDTLELDTALAPPPPPAGYRLLNDLSFPKYRDALLAGEKKDFATMLADLDAALRLTPGEPLYRRERVYALASSSHPLEALLEADDLVKTFPTATAYRYRALAARALSRREVVLGSLDAIVTLTRPGNPMYAEAICAKGIVLHDGGDPAGLPLIQQGCALEYQSCCDELKALRTTNVRTR